MLPLVTEVDGCCGPTVSVCGIPFTKKSARVIRYSGHTHTYKPFTAALT